MNVKRHLTRERYLEIADRCKVFSSSVDEYLIHHPVAKLDREIRHKLEKIAEIYQEVDRCLVDRLAEQKSGQKEDR